MTHRPTVEIVRHVCLFKTTDLNAACLVLVYSFKAYFHYGCALRCVARYIDRDAECFCLMEISLYCEISTFLRPFVALSLVYCVEVSLRNCSLIIISYHSP